MGRGGSLGPGSGIFRRSGYGLGSGPDLGPGMGLGGSGPGMVRGGSGFLNQFHGNHGLYDSRLLIVNTNTTIMITTRINIRCVVCRFISIYLEISFYLRIILGR